MYAVFCTSTGRRHFCDFGTQADAEQCRSTLQRFCNCCGNHEVRECEPAQAPPPEAETSHWAEFVRRIHGQSNWTGD
jgi:hypothetical protein